MQNHLSDYLAIFNSEGQQNQTQSIEKHRVGSKDLPSVTISSSPKSSFSFAGPLRVIGFPSAKTFASPFLVFKVGSVGFKQFKIIYICVLIAASRLSRSIHNGGHFIIYWLNILCASNDNLLSSMLCCPLCNLAAWWSRDNESAKMKSCKEHNSQLKQSTYTYIWYICIFLFVFLGKSPPLV